MANTDRAHGRASRHPVPTNRAGGPSTSTASAGDTWRDALSATDPLTSTRCSAIRVCASVRLPTSWRRTNSASSRRRGAIDLRIRRRRMPSWRQPSSPEPSWRRASWPVPSWRRPSSPEPSSRQPSWPAAFLAGAFLAAAFFAGAFFVAGAFLAEVLLTTTRAEAEGTRSASELGQRLEPLLEFVEALGHDGDLLRYFALHAGRDALGRLATAVDQRLHDSFGVASLDLALVDQLFDEGVGLLARDLGELDAGVDQLLDGGNLHRRMLVIHGKQGVRNGAQVGDIERAGRQSGHVGTGRAVEPLRTRANRHPSSIAKLPSVSIRSPTMITVAGSYGDVGRREQRGDQTTPSAGVACPPRSARRRPAVAIAARIEPPPGSSPVGVGYVGSAFVPINRAPRWTAAAALRSRA